MRNVHRALTYLGFGSVVMGAAIHGIACAKTAEDCNLLGEVCTGVLPPATTGTGGNGSGNPLCEQDPATNPDAISEVCGYFVKTGAEAMGDGSKAKPFGDLNSALALAGSGTEKKRVYVCKGDFSESIVVQSGVSLYGGFDCMAGWAAPAADARTTLTSMPDSVPIVFEGGNGNETSHIEGFAVTAANATTAGGSSIAAIAKEGAIVELKNCSITAGNGSAGDNGTSAPSSPPMSPVKGANGKTACENASQNNGGEQSENYCDVDTSMFYSIGGGGGDGTKSNGQAGQSGLAVPKTATSEGAGGVAEGACGAEGLGRPGAAGQEGMPGDGGSTIGMLSPTVGWVGDSGMDGLQGNPGQGGGGGAGQKGRSTAPTCAGASGGAGGAGGCGGAGGAGGKAGGSSIALVSINAIISFMDGVTLKAGNGGAGGAGGGAQPGATGSAGGNGGGNGGIAGLNPACGGGNGGKGGEGGPGGGGAGGHSLGIAYLGKAPSPTPMSITLGEKGLAGDGGSGNLKNNRGVDGVAESKLEFTATSSN